MVFPFTRVCRPASLWAERVPMCAQMTAQTGGAGGMAPQRETQPRRGATPPSTARGGSMAWAVTLLSGPPWGA